MKNPTYLIILLALGLLFTTYKWAASSKSDAPSEATEAVNPAIENIMTRTSVRAYTDRPVSEETLDTLLRAAMAAPTAANKQPWRFVVIRDHALLDSISAKFETMPMAKNAQAAVIICGDLESTLPGTASDFWIQDISAASENFLLAAHAVGLGAVWCGIYPQMDRVAEFSAMLHLPSTIVPLSCIPVGYPEGTPTPKDKWHPDYIHLNTWPH